MNYLLNDQTLINAGFLRNEARDDGHSEYKFDFITDQEIKVINAYARLMKVNLDKMWRINQVVYIQNPKDGSASIHFYEERFGMKIKVGSKHHFEAINMVKSIKNLRI